MTDTPDIAHRFDKFTMPCDIPDDDGAAGSERSAGGLRSPVCLLYTSPSPRDS